MTESYLMTTAALEHKAFFPDFRIGFFFTIIGNDTMNLRPIAGKPLVAWTIEQALAAKEEVAGEHELRVVVSTDDAELASEGAAEKVSTNLEEYLEKGIVK